MRRFLTALGLGAALAGPAQAQDGMYGKYETPRYTVIRDLGGAELRTYEPHLLAVVSVRGNQRGALNQGFRALAGYIFGGNDGGASVDMTSPVGQSAQIAMTSPVGQTQDDGVWTVTFMMPRAYDITTLPAPNNDAVRFVEVPARDMAVLTFSGRATPRALAAQTQTLEQIIARSGLETTGAPMFMFYDDPFTLPQARRNEVALQLQ